MRSTGGAVAGDLRCLPGSSRERTQQKGVKIPGNDGIERGPAATPEDFVKALEKRELARLQVPKIDIFHFEGERVSKWLELLEQITAEVPEADKFKYLPRYIWWEIRPEIMKVAAGAGGEGAKFKAETQRRFKLGDGLLTKTDLEMLQRDEFSTVGAFATTFEKMAKKVPGLAEEEQCATFLRHFKNWEVSSLTKKAAPGKKLTWAAIKEGVMDGELDQVDIFQMRQARKKRKTLDATTSDGRDFKKMVEDAVAQLDAAKEARRKTMAAPQTQGKAKKAVVQEKEEEEEEEEPEPQKLTKAQRKARNLAQGGQGSERGQIPQAVAMPPPESPSQAALVHYGSWPSCGHPSHWHGHCSYAPWPRSGPHGSCAEPSVSAASCGCPGPQVQQVSRPNPPPNQPQQSAPQGSQGNQGGGRGQNQGWGRGRGNGGRGGNGRGNGGGNASRGGNEGWTASGSQGGQEGGRGAGRGRVDWRNAICWHCGQKGHTIKFYHVRRNDEDEGLISTNYDGDMYDKWGYHLDPKIPGGTRKEALRRAEAGEPPAPPAMFRIWLEKEVRSNVRVEEVGENAEVEQEKKAGTTKIEPIIVESDNEIEEDCWNRTGRAPHAVRTRAKRPVSPEEPAKDVPEPSGEKEVVDVPEGEDDEDDRLRKEDEKAEQRAKKRRAKPDTDKAQEVKKKRYVVLVEEGFDVEEIMDRILEGHNHLMNLKDVLASAPRLRDELRARLSRKMVASIRLGTIIPKETEWEKRIRDLEAKYAQQAPTRVLDWTEVQRFEVREQPAEEVFKKEKEVEMADQLEGEEVPLIDKEMLEQPEVLAGKGVGIREFEWRLPAGLTLGHEPAVLQEGPPAEVVGVDAVLPPTQGETMGRPEGQESVGQTMVGTEQGVDLRDCQESTMLQEVPVATDLRDVLGSWATGSGSDGRIGEPGMPADDRAACPASSGVPQ
ncbi:hypothetical protein CBR_g19409 [Chara braunii]|uniref:Uncharacterized protein n=1 Tax=Chara braunii TaxID=69332 RepID=A0A388KXW1_CHABU|nr:hypothetical protein CBR_g19409 [Chara braunii]|eukprot:GBG74896.1 hypothetical protein CBR_g19409 [Chara braunii]